MEDWTRSLGPLARSSRAALDALPLASLPKGAVLFTPGAEAQGFPVILSGRVEVTLTTATGREILLYAVAPGQSCVQTTLGLMGGEPYSATATTVGEVRAILIPRALFLRLMDEDPAFRAFVLRVFGQRMTDLTRLLEQVAFASVEARLAATLLSLEVGGLITTTQAALATRLGTAREVVSRRLEAWAAEGILVTGRGQIRLTDLVALRRIAEAGAL